MFARAGDLADGFELAVAVVAFRFHKEVGGVADAAGEHAIVDDIHRQHLGGLLVDQAPAGAFQAHQATAGGGNTNGAATIVAMGDGHGTGGHQGGAAPGRPAGGVVAVPGVAGGGHAHLFGTGGEAEGGQGAFAQQVEALGQVLFGDAAGFLQWRLAQGAAAVAGGQAAQVQVVLDQAGHTGEEAVEAFAVGALAGGVEGVQGEPFQGGLHAL